MFDDLSHLIKYSKIPELVKVSVSIIVKAASWFPWVFFFIGLALDKQFFLYWLIFFICLEGSLLLALIYILVLIVKHAFATPISDPSTQEVKKKDTLIESSVNGIIGNIAFYIFLFVFFVGFKLSGVFDTWFRDFLSHIGV